MNAEQSFSDAFGHLSPADREEAERLVTSLAHVIAELPRYFDGADEGGAVRVGHMLVTLGYRLAGVPPPWN